jgi:hypothetical protein
MIRTKAEQHEKKNGVFGAQGFHRSKNIAVGRSSSGCVYALVQDGEKSDAYALDWVKLPDNSILP